jgi:rhamnogalacturonyl hydrolase YesR
MGVVNNFDKVLLSKHLQQSTKTINSYTMHQKLSLFIAATLLSVSLLAQAPKTTDVNTPLYLLPPDYPMPYGPLKAETVIASIDRIYSYLEGCTPARLINRVTKAEITDLSKTDTLAVMESGTFRLSSYEWGVTYGAMLSATESTGNPKYAEYATSRIGFLASLYPFYKKMWDNGFQKTNPYKRVFEPQALDDCGSMCVAMIKASKSLDNKSLRPMIDGFADFVMNKVYRLPDGTIARNRPQRNTLWLDDMYMSIPAMAQMGVLTGDKKYFDEATKQVLLFADRMFVKEKGLFRHGWVEEMTEHPAFFWGRANGWGILTLSELLDVLPESHPNRAKVFELYRAHIRGIAQYQNGNGFWHQLLDRNDSYPETSATAIFTYCIAHGINKGWIDPGAYGPVAILGWNALSTKINAQGQVEGTCVGTGMGFDPAFYYYRPTNPLAAHGYGPTILAGAEMLKLMKNYQIVINETSVMFYKPGVDWRNLQIR